MESMNKYLTYTEYRNLGGDIPEMSFKRLEYRAEKKIDEQTFGRFLKIKSYPQELKMCVYELINEYKKEFDSSNIASESDGDYSITYANTSKKEIESNIAGTIKFWLSNITIDGVPVLYCGVDLNENRC